ncbi:MAG: YicC family protein [Rhizobiales bacterium 65-9]|nr:YicC family protein [Hyphomicrobiales bacterium]OJY37640.1 MAG: YicC family protein [Rhizobiales bacterium 65-9]
MSLFSMTGFARVVESAAAGRIVWELKSVNGKSLDIRLRAPPGLDDLAEEARRRIGAVLKRGTCFASLAVQREERPPVVTVNEELLGRLVEVAGRYAGRSGLAPPALDGLLAVRGVVEIAEAREDDAAEAAFRGDALKALDSAVAALAAARREEGRALDDILALRLSDIARLTDEAERSPARRPEAVRRRLAEQVAALLDSGRELDPNRLHQEAVLLASRADIREELDRLKAHVEAARALIASGGAVGRRLDFLAQEMAREANTLSAKANDIALNATGLELKTIVEQFREQVQNVE